MKRNLFIILCSLLALPFVAHNSSAQGFKEMRINEIMVNNVSGYEDDFGVKASWVELYNSGYASANLSGTFLRLISGGDTTTYKVPTNDTRTIIPAQGYAIFFADGSSNKGTFYTNFKLNDSANGVQRLELLDQSGSNVIDSIVYETAKQGADISYGRHKNHQTQEITLQVLDHVTPLQANELEEPVKKSEIFRTQDPSGTAMAAIAMSVVFSALILLFLVFKGLGIVMQRSAASKERKALKAAAPKAVEVKSADGEDEFTGEKIAAITLALHLYDQDMHDNESNVITINKVARAYSPWSSKIYSLRQIPNKKTW